VTSGVKIAIKGDHACGAVFQSRSGRGLGRRALWKWASTLDARTVAISLGGAARVFEPEHGRERYWRRDAVRVRARHSTGCCERNVERHCLVRAGFEQHLGIVGEWRDALRDYVVCRRRVERCDCRGE
jgi:hypothetical protein